MLKNLNSGALWTYRQINIFFSLLNTSETPDTCCIIESLWVGKEQEQKAKETYG